MASSTLSTRPPSVFTDDGQSVGSSPPSTPDNERAGYPAIYPELPKSALVDEVDDRDVGTPDEWIKRDPRLVRLTGKHPLNCEPKLDTLFEAGFLTPPELFYVRNHGATPRVTQAQRDAWTISVEGLVAKPLTFSLQDLKTKFQTVSFPVTLVCAGNRRKEQNVVRKGLGFNWGAGGVSTAIFTGVLLADVLEAAQPIRPARHVIFEGSDQLPKGPYGTSQLLSWARDRSKGMLIAWAMNGEPLPADHGYPVRVVIPGQIGGRSVKWLTKVEVSAQESQHYLHFWDNKLLPTQVSPEEARSEAKWWYDRKYLINELNTNSAIAKPDHDEVLDTSTQSLYQLKGYAYAGGGRRVNRVEISLDDGLSWELAEVDYPEDRYRQMVYQDDTYGTFDMTDTDTCFCWCFWTLIVSTKSLAASSVIMVRAMDEGLSGQPRDMYWNATSMMNNWYFRIAVHREGDRLRFEHPTLAGVAAGGWMERLKEQGQDVLQPRFSVDAGERAAPAAKREEVSMVKSGVTRLVTMNELLAHSGAQEPWFVVAGEVYDGTAFLNDHPGGGDSIILMAGQDATEDFMSIHSPSGKAQLADFHIGTLVVKEELQEKEEAASIEPIFLSKTKWKKAHLQEIEVVNHDSRLYRFRLEREDQELGLPVGQHVFARLRRKTHSKEVVQGELVQRAYTPVSPAGARGTIDLLIKLYRADGTRAGGKMTSGFDELVIGDHVEFKGPLGSFVWLGDGVASWKSKERKVRRLGMLCGGSGITPILAVARAVVAEASDIETELWLIDANKTEVDILCKEELDDLVRRSDGRFRLHHTLSNPPDGWKHSRGRMTQQMLAEHLPLPAEDALVLICGPDAMINETAKPALTALGWDIATQLVVF